MAFNSIQFLIFFSLISIGFFITPHRWRWILLLIASYYFYMCWIPEYICLILFSTLVDYFAGNKMGNLETKTRRRPYLILSLLANLGLLFVFKYYDFFSDSISGILHWAHVPVHMTSLDLILPIGISFYTFQTLSYSIDVYQGRRKPEKHLGMFALYVSFFPQLVAGPIERSTRLLPQFFEKKTFDYRRVSDGLKLMMWGLFKKMVIADSLAMIVNPVYANPSEFNSVQLLFATVFFGYQIYCDFSGYTDIAIGAAQVLGFDLMKNFRQPYFADSVSNFWTRWHISLSSWFRDYVYIPLGGNRVETHRMYMNWIIVFLLSGLWHGAQWTFVIWGALHATYMILGHVFKNFRLSVVRVMGLHRIPLVHQFLRIMITFILVNFAWIFFRAESLVDAFYISISLWQGVLSFSWQQDFLRYFTNSTIMIAVLLIIFLEVVHIIQARVSIRSLLSKQPFAVKFFVYLFGVISLIGLGSQNSGEQFIYFQF